MLEERGTDKENMKINFVFAENKFPVENEMILVRLVDEYFEWIQ